MHYLVVSMNPERNKTMKIFVSMISIVLLFIKLNGCGTMYFLTCRDKFHYADSSAGRIYGGIRVDVNGEGLFKDIDDIGNLIMLPSLQLTNQ